MLDPETLALTAATLNLNSNVGGHITACLCEIFSRKTPFRRRTTAWKIVFEFLNMNTWWPLWPSQVAFYLRRFFADFFLALVCFDGRPAPLFGGGGATSSSSSSSSDSSAYFGLPPPRPETNHMQSVFNRTDHIAASISCLSQIQRQPKWAIQLYITARLRTIFFHKHKSIITGRKCAATARPHDLQIWQLDKSSFTHEAYSCLFWVEEEPRLPRPQIPGLFSVFHVRGLNKATHACMKRFVPHPESENKETNALKTWDRGGWKTLASG